MTTSTSGFHDNQNTTWPTILANETAQWEYTEAPSQPIIIVINDTERYFLLILVSVMILLGTYINGFTILVISTQNRFDKPEYTVKVMFALTNMGILVFFSLAQVIPRLLITDQGQYPILACRLFSVLGLTLLFMSMSSTAIVSVTRYLQFCRPLLYMAHVTHRTIYDAFALAFAVAALYTSATEIFIGRHFVVHALVCQLPQTSVNIFTSNALFMVLPLLVIIWCTHRIRRVIREVTSEGGRSIAGLASGTRHRRASTMIKPQGNKQRRKMTHESMVRSEISNVSSDRQQDSAASGQHRWATTRNANLLTNSDRTKKQCHRETNRPGSIEQDPSINTPMKHKQTQLSTAYRIHNKTSQSIGFYTNELVRNKQHVLKHQYDEKPQQSEYIQGPLHSISSQLDQPSTSHASQSDSIPLEQADTSQRYASSTKPIVNPGTREDNQQDLKSLNSNSGSRRFTQQEMGTEFYQRRRHRGGQQRDNRAQQQPIACPGPHSEALKTIKLIIVLSGTFLAMQLLPFVARLIIAVAGPEMIDWQDGEFPVSILVIRYIDIIYGLFYPCINPVILLYFDKDYLVFRNYALCKSNEVGVMREHRAMSI